MSFFGSIINRFAPNHATSSEQLPYGYLFNSYAAAFGVHCAESVYMLESITASNRMYQFSPTQMMKIVCKEAAKLALTDYNITLSDIAGSDEMAKFIEHSVADLISNLPRYLEIGLALGGLIFKPAHNGISIVSPLNFIPTAFDSLGNITEAIFIDYIRRNGKIYTKLEYHHWLASDYCIDTKVFVSDTFAEIGTLVEPTIVAEWAKINTSVTIANLSAPLFSYFRVPGTNSIDETSTLGTSFAAAATEYLRSFDSVFAGLKADMETTRKVIFVNNAALLDINKKQLNIGGRAAKGSPQFTHNPIPTLIVGINGNADMIKEFNPSCNVNSFKTALQMLLNLISIACGMSTGWLVFDTKTGRVTATQVESEDSATVSTIVSIRSSLNRAIEGAINSLVNFLQLYNKSPFAFKINFYARDLSATPYADRERVMQLVRDGLYPLDKYLKEFEGLSADEVAAFILQKGEKATEDDSEVDIDSSGIKTNQ